MEDTYHAWWTGLCSCFRDRGLWGVSGLVLLYTIVLSWFTILQHYAYESSFWDLGLFEQSLWTTLHGQLLNNTAEGMSHFGVHNSPVLLLLVPLYGVFPYTETLLVAQSLLLGLGAIPVYLLAKDVLDGNKAILFAALYLLYPALHGINFFDFHEVAFLPLVALFSFYFLHRKNIIAFVVCSLFCLMVKEDASLIIAMFGLYGWYLNRGKGWNETFPYIGVTLLSIIWTAVSVFYLIPFFNTAGVYQYFGIYGNTTANIAWEAPEKGLYIVNMLLPFGFLPLLSPGTFVLSLPAWAEVLFSSRAHFRFAYHYSAILIPFIVISSVFGLKWLQGVEWRSVGRRTGAILVAICLISLANTLVNPASPLSVSYGIPTPTDQHHIIDQVIQKIPPGASVSTQNDIGAHLATREHLYFGYRDGVDYIVLHTGADPWDEMPLDVNIAKERYHQVFYQGGVLVLERNGLERGSV